MPETEKITAHHLSSGEKLTSMESGPSLVLTNVHLPSGRVVDISIRDGHVVHSGASVKNKDALDCSGLIVLPGAVDMHVHMRGGVQAEKEDWRTGSMSALAGGVTVVVDQPNTVPAIDSPEIFGHRVNEARSNSLCQFAINSAVTPDTPFDAMWRAGAMAFGETFFAPSSYGDAVGDEVLGLALDRIHSFGGLATIHAEEIGEGPDVTLEEHDYIRSWAGEVRAVASVKKLNRSGCRLHFCHMSSGLSIDAAPGTVEVTPHHLFLSRDEFRPDDAHGKVNPPLRSGKGQAELWSRWDEIDVIASDHAPHTKTEKDAGFAGAPSGIPGVETMVPLLLARYLEGRISLASIIGKTSRNPSDILGIPRPGFEIGERADFALFRREARPIDADTLHSRCGWSPFEQKMAVFPDTVIMAGSVVFREGEFFPGNPSWFPGQWMSARNSNETTMAGSIGIDLL